MSKSDDGFTVIEILVALIISSAIMAGMYRGLGLGWRSLRAAEAEHRALAVARAELAATGLALPLAASTRSGEAPGGVEWTVTVRPFMAYPESDEITSAVPMQAFWVEAGARWREHGTRVPRSLTLKTIKLRGADVRE